MMPRRVVSLVPSSSETVCRLGAADRLVGITRYCTEPADLLGRLPTIGGTKNPDRERVLALRPDLVLGNAEENRAEDIAWLAGRVPVLVQTPRSVAEAARGLAELAARLGAEAAAAPLLASIERSLALAAEVRSHAERPRVYYAIWRKPWMGANADTYIHDVLTLAGAVNVCAEAGDRYPRVEPALLVERGLDLVLLASEPWPFSATEREEIAAERTFGSASIRLCDGRDFCWHGAHTGPGLRAAIALLRPETAGAAATRMEGRR